MKYSNCFKKIVLICGLIVSFSAVSGSKFHEPSDEYLSRVYSALKCPTQIGIEDHFLKYKYCLRTVEYKKDIGLVEFSYQLTNERSDIDVIKKESKSYRKEKFHHELDELATLLGISGHLKYSSSLNALDLAHTSDELKRASAMTNFSRKNSYLQMIYLNSDSKEIYIGYLDSKSNFYYGEFKNFQFPSLQEIKNSKNNAGAP
jgi:hypothetical protein